MKLFKNLSNKGDTIVEVMLAMSLLTLILMTAWSITNKSTAITQAARKRIDMVNRLKEQAEMLQSERSRRFDTHTMVGDNGSFINQSQTVPKPSTDFCTQNIVNSPPTDLPANAFYIDTNSSNKLIVQSGLKDATDSNGKIWIQMDATNTKYADFYIRGCWQTTGGSQKLDNAQVVLRLNI